MRFGRRPVAPTKSAAQVWSVVIQRGHGGRCDNSIYFFNPAQISRNDSRWDCPCPFLKASMTRAVSHKSWTRFQGAGHRNHWLLQQCWPLWYAVSAWVKKTKLKQTIRSCWICVRIRRQRPQAIEAKLAVSHTTAIRVARAAMWRAKAPDGQLASARGPYLRCR